MSIGLATGGAVLSKGPGAAERGKRRVFLRTEPAASRRLRSPLCASRSSERQGPQSCTCSEAKSCLRSQLPLCRRLRTDSEEIEKREPIVSSNLQGRQRRLSCPLCSVSHTTCPLLLRVCLLSGLGCFGKRPRARYPACRSRLSPTPSQELPRPAALVEPQLISSTVVAGSLAPKPASRRCFCRLLSRRQLLQLCAPVSLSRRLHPPAPASLLLRPAARAPCEPPGSCLSPRLPRRPPRLHAFPPLLKCA
jgi:hypothetical protein